MPSPAESISRLFHRLTRKRRRPKATPSAASDGLHFESLEFRRLLAVSNGVPTIQGTVYVDNNGDDMVSAGEELPGVTVQLFLDDGDGVFEPDGDDGAATTLVTDANGEYCFDGLDGTASYFLRQPSQTVGALTLSEQVSSLLSPGQPQLIIDSFETNQQAQAIPPAPSSDGSTLAFADESEVIGQERDLFVELQSGVGEVQLLVNPFNLLPVLQFNSSSGVLGGAVVTWDGQDFSASQTPSMGLGGRDLTEGGQNTGIGTVIGIDQAGAGDTLTVRIFQGDASNVSEAVAPIPVSDGTAVDYLYIPWSDFSGPVTPDNVDAIQIVIGTGGVPSADGQIAFIGAVGPLLENVRNSPGTDVAITKNNSTSTVVPGETVSYEIVVENLGPEDVVGAVVEDNFPAAVQGPTYTSTTTGTVSGNTTSGSGDINDTIDITVGSTVTYTVTGTVSPSATGTLTNTATVTLAAGDTELDPSNNTDSESDTITPEVDLTITKTDGVTEVRPGDSVTYTIVVTNQGPSDVVGATITDMFPATLTNVTYTSTTGGTASGNTASGSGDISDTVSMSVGASITYTVTATVSDAAQGTLSNTATVTEPNGTTERNPTDNTATDEDEVIQEVDLVVTKTNNVESAVPGETITYQIVVQNLGPQTATNATFSDPFPAELTNVSYTSVATGGATGNTASGSGDLSETLTLPAGSSVTYTVTATVVANATGTLTNTATVTAPNDVVDVDLDNNIATDTDTLTPMADLSVTKTDNVTSAAPNDVLTYEITVTNAGPSDVTGATLLDMFPAELTGVTYTSTGSGGASGNTASGSGDLNETLDLPVGASVTYEVMATVLESAANDIINTVTASVPTGVTDPNTSNNTATDIDTLVGGVDLQITKTSGSDTVYAGAETTYTLVVTNNGPNATTDATIVDAMPAELINVTYTSVATGGATGNTTSGTGDISDTVDMPVGSTITYTIEAMVLNTARGTLSNTATVTPSTDFIELVPENNASTTSNAIDIVLAEITGFVYVDLDNDGIRDANEPPIPGVEIILEQNGSQVEQTLTDATGAYTFDDLQPGNYEVVETQPDEFRNGKTTVGGGIGTVIDDDRIAVPLNSADRATELNFGELPAQPSKRSLLASSFRTTN